MDNETPVGGFQFKIMMQKAVIDTRVIATCLRENLTNLDTYMFTVNSDIDNFNQYGIMNVHDLKEVGGCA